MNPMVFRRNYGPAICQQVHEALGGFGCYLVGSALERPDWRDVDVRLIMKDEEFAELFPAAGHAWEQDPRWLLLNVSIAERLSKLTGLPVDFQIQPQTHANERHSGKRHAIGFRVANQHENPAEVETYRVSEAARISRLGMAKIREAVKSGVIPRVPFIRTILIPKIAFHAWLRSGKQGQ